MRIPCDLPLPDGAYIELKKDSEQRWIFAVNDQNIFAKVSVPAHTAPLTRDHYRCVYHADDKTASIIRFADLHRHSDNSLMDGLSKVPDIVKATEYAGALTDHGNMHGFLEYFLSMKEAGKKPIIGFEAYVEDLNGDLNGAHLILLAKNQSGYKNLLYLTSEAYDHFHGKPHVTWEMMQNHHDGVVATSACAGGLIQKYLSAGDRESAEFALKRFLQIFGTDFYIEIHRHDFRDEEILMGQMAQLASKYGVKLLAVTDSHYTKPEDKRAHEALLCLQTKKTLSEPHWSFPGTGYHIHNSEEMEQLFWDMPEALDNTLDLAEQCNVEVPLNERNMAKFQVPAPFSNDVEYFEYLCDEGFKKRFAGTPMLMSQEYHDRYQYELKIIKKMGFASYFLIVQDYANWARAHDIYVGPGRGSAAGSLLAYCLGITDLDPIKYGLLFERFLNPDRVSMPDVDMDFEHTRRQEVIDYVRARYGEENVCRIVTFGTLAAKQSVKDMARVLGYPVSKGLEISKMIPQDPHMTLDLAMNMNEDFKQAYQNDTATKEIVDMAKRLEGCKRNAGVHACGIALSPSPVRNYLPVSQMMDDDIGQKVVTSQVVGPEIEALSILKMDFLGLKNMTVIHDVLKNIEKTRGLTIDYHDIPLNDRTTYEMLRDGLTGGVFQLESEGMTNVVTRMLSDLDELPDDQMDQCFERMIAAVALYRPGPMDFIDDYISGMKNASLIHYDHPMLESILQSTYGIIVYQEQVMQIVRKLAGYDLARADVVRKAMGKKKDDIMNAEREVFLYGNKDAFQSGKDKKFVPGCLANGVPEQIAITIWDKMKQFARYAFNRSHAACYAYIAVLTAYMRCHWTAEFYAAMCNAFRENSDKLCGYLVQADKAHLKILPPDLNCSDVGFVSDNGKDIRFGFAGLKGVKGYAPKLVQERKEHGEFTGPQDFCRRMIRCGNKPNKTILEALTWSGAMNAFGYTKTALLQAWTQILDTCETDQKVAESGQFSLFGPETTVEVKPVQEAPKSILIEKEHEMVGFYLTEHPVDMLYPMLNPKDNIVPISSFPSRDTRFIRTVGLISDVRIMFTKKDNRRMFSFTLSDRFSSVRCIVFPQEAESNAVNIQDNKVVVIEGSYTAKTEEESAQIIVRNIMSQEQVQHRADCVVVTIRNRREQTMLLDYAAQHRGTTMLVISANGKFYQTKQTIGLTVGCMDWLKNNFTDVSCG